MIFDKEVYLKTNIVESFFKRLSLLFLSKHESDKPLLSELNLYPQADENMSIDDIDKLNSLCHVDAFSFENNDVLVDVTLCDSCGKCTEFDGRNIVMKELFSFNSRHVSLRN